jgi:hypothetical protein
MMPEEESKCLSKILQDLKLLSGNDAAICSIQATMSDIETEEKRIKLFLDKILNQFENGLNDIVSANIVTHFIDGDMDKTQALYLFETIMANFLSLTYKERYKAHIKTSLEKFIYLPEMYKSMTMENENCDHVCCRVMNTMDSFLSYFESSD